MTTSREAGEICDFEGVGTGDDGVAVKAELDQRWEWIWQEDLPGELEEARKVLGAGVKL